MEFKASGSIPLISTKTRSQSQGFAVTISCADISGMVRKGFSYCCRPYRPPLYQLCVEQKGADRSLSHLALQSLKCALAQLSAVLPDGRQGRRSIPAQRDVIEANNAQILRHPDARFPAMDQQHMGQQIVAANDGGAAILQQPGKMPVQALGKAIGITRQLTFVSKLLRCTARKKAEYLCW